MQTAPTISPASQGEVQAYLAYYEGGVFKYVSTPELPMATKSLQESKAYRVRANTNGYFNMSGVGGTVESESFNWADLMLFNGTEERNITDANESGWIFSTGLAEHMSYELAGIPKTVCGDDLVECEETVLYPWTGYWLWSNYNDVIISRRY